MSSYDADQSLIVEVDLKRFQDDEPIAVMETSTCDQQEYRSWRAITLDVEDSEAALVVYVDNQGGFFLPFKDSTNGK